MVFDTETGFLRRIRAGEVEAVRGVYAAVRDQEWRTIPIDVAISEKSVRRRSFHVEFDVTAASGPVDFRWLGTLTGDEAGVVRYEMKGRAYSDFLRNRIGICLLHPIDGFAGGPCTVEHVDGSREDVVIPEKISPHQTALDIRALAHRIDDDLRVEVRFEGDVFEMEDQRNWSDASFKTYSTPLRLPAPVRIREGDSVAQAVTIRIHGTRKPAAPGVYVSSGAVTLDVDEEESGRVPAVGAYFSGAREAVAFPLGHLRVDVDASRETLEQRLSAAAAAAERLSTPLFISAVIGDADRLAEAVSTLTVPIERWLPLGNDGISTTEADARACRKAVKGDAAIGGGSNGYFVEVNRFRPPSNVVDFVCFSINGQPHVFDDLSIMETLPIHAELVKNTRDFSGGCPVAVSPVTLRARDDPQAGPDAGFAPGTGYDPRQNESFGAAWTAGSFIHLCNAGADIVTYFDVSTIREPLTSLVRRLVSWRGLRTRRARSSDPARVLALAVGSTPHSLLVVNLTPFEQKVSVGESETFELPPYGHEVF